MKQLKQIDNFGVTFAHNIIKDDSQFKTVFGGIMTLIIYALSTAYTIYILYQWAYGNIPPTTNFSTQTLNNFTYVEENVFLDIGLLGMPGVFYNPFNQTRRYLQPFFLNLPDFQVNTMNLIQASNDSSKLSLKNFDVKTHDEKFYFLGIFRCQNTTTFSDCASDQEIDQFLNSPLLKISVQIYLSEFDKKSKKISDTKVQKQLVNFVDPNKTIYQQMYLKLSRTEVQDGLIFQSESQHYFIGNVEVQSQALSQDVFKQTFATQQNPQFIYGLLISLDQQVLVTTINYPTAGVVIAQIGSIVSLIMFLQILVTYVNSFKLQAFIEDSLIQFYYPQFKQLKLEKNLKGQIMRVIGVNGDYEPKQVNDIYIKARQFAKQKINILNICYEISRIQFILQSIYPRETLRMVKKVGIQLPLRKVQKADKIIKNNKTGMQLQDSTIKIISDSVQNENDGDPDILKVGIQLPIKKFQKADKVIKNNKIGMQLLDSTVKVISDSVQNKNDSDPDILIDQDFELLMLQDKDNYKDQEMEEKKKPFNIPKFIEKNMNSDFT